MFLKKKSIQILVWHFVISLLIFCAFAQSNCIPQYSDKLYGTKVPVLLATMCNFSTKASQSWGRVLSSTNLFFSIALEIPHQTTSSANFIFAWFDWSFSWPNRWPIWLDFIQWRWWTLRNIVTEREQTIERTCIRDSSYPAECSNALVNLWKINFWNEGVGGGWGRGQRPFRVYLKAQVRFDTKTKQDIRKGSWFWIRQLLLLALLFQ